VIGVHADAEGPVWSVPSVVRRDEARQPQSAHAYPNQVPEHGYELECMPRAAICSSCRSMIKLPTPSSVQERLYALPM
jgi:hypothetical protein